MQQKKCGEYACLTWQVLPHAAAQEDDDGGAASEPSSRGNSPGATGCKPCAEAPPQRPHGALAHW